MDKGDMIKSLAIITLLVMFVIDAFTWRIDGVLVGSIAAVIGGIAGYEISRGKKK
jgi:predicted membrane-bound dolichyl-phosphate-mannose-protein mannosyltransferase